MDDFSGVYEGEDVLATRIPATVVQEKPDPLQAKFEELRGEIGWVESRFQDALDFIRYAASQGPCRCDYMKDPGCVVCKAKTFLSQWYGEEAQPPVLPPV